MKLNTQQIQELYKFTRQHYVEHYDVQTELVDHLANDIEHIWENKPNLTFEQARDKSFKKFGVCGFMDIVDERTKALEKKYWKLVWQVFKQFFKLPQIIFTITLTIVLYQLFKAFPQKATFAIISAIILITIIIRLIFLQRQKRKRFSETNKKWLLEDSIYRLGNLLLFLNVFFQISILQTRNLESTTMLLVATFLYTTVILIVYITAFILPSKIENILENQHPEYNFVTNR
ncbi:MAG: hypothetical protein COA67_03145 [Lutibacter sp.]|nr:MAG: hypothetical protein COA67_03145 [Lutibacter sp.]